MSEFFQEFGTFRVIKLLLSSDNKICLNFSPSYLIFSFVIPSGSGALCCFKFFNTLV